MGFRASLDSSALPIFFTIRSGRADLLRRRRASALPRCVVAFQISRMAALLGVTAGLVGAAPVEAAPIVFPNLDANNPQLEVVVFLAGTGWKRSIRRS